MDTPFLGVGGGTGMSSSSDCLFPITGSGDRSVDPSDEEPLPDPGSVSGDPLSSFNTPLPSLILLILLWYPIISKSGTGIFEAKFNKA